MKTVSGYKILSIPDGYTATICQGKVIAVNQEEKPIQHIRENIWGEIDVPEVENA